uniref:Glutaredoxin domain-containing protein n=1 Tax=Ciona savignyi TaxID=51511 RepID=H2Z773_CIOSA
MVIRVYWASVTGNRKVDGEQTRLRNIIESLKVDSTWVDITTDPLIKQKMRDECCNARAMPPQIFNDEKYLGDVEDMEYFVEQERAIDFFTGQSVDSIDGTSSDVRAVVNDVTEPKFTQNRNNSNSSSPTSSIENEQPITVLKSCEQKSQICNYVAPPRKNVLAAVGAFESLKDQPPKIERPKVVFSKSKVTEPCKTSDEERKRRILGLLSRDNSDIQSTVSNLNGDRTANKISLAT